MKNRTIWKIALAVADAQTIEVPTGAEILCAREQFEQICIWFLCDSIQPLEKRDIIILGTGNPAPGNEGRYLGTASLSGGTLMFHVFEKVRQP